MHHAHAAGHARVRVASGHLEGELAPAGEHAVAQSPGGEPVSAETSSGPVPQYGRTFTLQLTGSY